MTIYQRMQEVFQRAGLPGFLQEWQRTDDYPEIPDRFCTYTVPMEADALCADDQEWIHRYDITVHLYSKGDASAERVELICALRESGFQIVRTRDLMDVRAGSYLYHQRLDLVYYEAGDAGKGG